MQLIGNIKHQTFRSYAINTDRVLKTAVLLAGDSPCNHICDVSSFSTNSMLECENFWGSAAIVVPDTTLADGTAGIERPQ